MKVIKKDSKQGKAFFEAWQKGNYNLLHFYQNPSNAKCEAWCNCIDEMHNTKGGYGFRVMSANTFQFTCGYLVHYWDEVLGYVDYMIVHTRDNVYKVVE